MTKRPPTSKKRARAPKSSSAIGPKAVTAAELRALRREIDRRVRKQRAPVATGSGRTRSPGRRTGKADRSPQGRPLRWNPDPEEVQRSVAQLVLTLVEFLRRLMERQAIRRMEAKTLTPAEVEAVGLALMKLEETVREIGGRFGLAPEDLNLDLGPVGKLM
jgi:hypothetical protein